MKKVNFYKKDSKWLCHVDSQAKISEMASGGDKFCELVAHNSEKIQIYFSHEPFDGCECLELFRLGKLDGLDLSQGGWYYLETYADMPYGLNIWLGDMPKLIFGEFPRIIYFS